MRSTHTRLGLAVAAAKMASASEAFAQVEPGGTVDYGVRIPTLSGAVLVLLGLLLAVLAYGVLRTALGGWPLASFVAVAVAALSSVSGMKMIQEAHATIGFVMDQPSGGSVDIGVNGVDVPLSNASGRPQQIKGLIPDSGCQVGIVTNAPACTVGKVVQNGNACWINRHCGDT